MGFVGVSKALGGFDVPNPLADAPLIQTDDSSITWVGDTFLGDGAQPFIDKYGLAWPSALLPPLDASHVVIANLEGPMTELTEPFDPMQRWSYQADPEVADALNLMGIDAVSLANNHAMDRGPEGLADTIEYAGSAGLITFGAGPTSATARLPLILDLGSQRIAILGFSDDGGIKTATTDRPGVRRLSVPNLQTDIEVARSAEVDYVVASVHWGGNYTSLDSRQRAWANSFAEAGYDMVVGTGPHVVQPIEEVNGMPVVYSLGNYVFGTPGRFNENEGELNGFGLVVTTRFNGREVLISARCIQTDNVLVGYQARRCQNSIATAVLSGANQSLAISDDTGVITMSLPPSAG